MSLERLLRDANSGVEGEVGEETLRRDIPRGETIQLNPANYLLL